MKLPIICLLSFLILTIFTSKELIAKVNLPQSIDIHGTITLGYSAVIQYKYSTASNKKKCLRKTYRDHVYYPFTSIPRADYKSKNIFTKRKQINVNEDGTYNISQEVILSNDPKKCDFRLHMILVKVVDTQASSLRASREYTIYVNSFNNSRNSVSSLEVTCTDDNYIDCMYNNNSYSSVTLGDVNIDFTIQE